MPGRHPKDSVSQAGDTQAWKLTEARDGDSKRGVIKTVIDAAEMDAVDEADSTGPGWERT